MKEHFCTNAACKCYGLRGLGNLVKAGTYDRRSFEEKRQLLKCTVCGRRFSETCSTLFTGSHYSADMIRSIIVSVAEGNSIRSTATKLGISKDRANKIILKVDAYLEMMFSNLLRSLYLNENQTDKLWLLVTRKNVGRKKPSGSPQAGKDADNISKLK